LTTHTSFNPYHAASCEEILKKEAALGSIHPWRVLFHRAEGRGREEERKRGERGIVFGCTQRMWTSAFKR
jgi:hypothetical protein